MQATPSLRAAAGVRWRTGWPSISIVPPSGTCAPVMTLMSVDLPAPFSPTNACTSPARRSNDTPFSARTPSKDLVTAVSWRRGAFIGGGTFRSPGSNSRAQNFPLVALHLRQPRLANRHAVGLAAVVPHGAKRQRAGFFLQRDPGRVVAGRFGGPDGGRLEQA